MKKCRLCGLSTEAIHRHEIFSGSDNRTTSIQYWLFALLCPECHKIVHQLKETYQQELCKLQGLNYPKLRQIVQNKAKKHWTPKEREYMEKVREHMKKVLKKQGYEPRGRKYE